VTEGYECVSLCMLNAKSKNSGFITQLVAVNLRDPTHGQKTRWVRFERPRYTDKH